MRQPTQSSVAFAPPAMRRPSSWFSIRATVLVLVVQCLTVGLAKRPPATNKSTTRGITILNESGSRVEIYWVHPTTREGSLMSTPNIMNGASFPLNSFVGHEFEVRELPSVKSGVCAGEEQTCRSNYFTVSANDDQSEYHHYYFAPVFWCPLDPH